MQYVGVGQCSRVQSAGETLVERSCPPGQKPGKEASLTLRSQLGLAGGPIRKATQESGESWDRRRKAVGQNPRCPRDGVRLHVPLLGRVWWI